MKWNKEGKSSFFWLISQIAYNKSFDNKNKTLKMDYSENFSLCLVLILSVNVREILCECGHLNLKWNEKLFISNVQKKLKYEKLFFRNYFALAHILGVWPGQAFLACVLYIRIKRSFMRNQKKRFLGSRPPK